LFLKRNFQHGLITSGVKGRDRVELIDKFMNRPNSKGEKYPKNERPHVLVSTFQLISTGLNLDRACRVIFLEPSIQFFWEEQGAMRVSRISQTANKTYVYRLVTTDSALETYIRESQNVAADVTRLTLEYCQSTKYTSSKDTAR
jgi:SNF2 family DNA or RNA helicase